MTNNDIVKGDPTLPPYTGAPCKTNILIKHHRTQIFQVSLYAITRPLELLIVTCMAQCLFLHKHVHGISSLLQITTPNILGFILLPANLTSFPSFKSSRNPLNHNSAYQSHAFILIEGKSTYLICSTHSSTSTMEFIINLLLPNVRLPRVLS